MDLSDLELMQKLRDGDDTALSVLMERHQQPLANFFRRLGAYRDAEDLVQETFVRLYRYRRRYRPAARFTTFLYTLARHAWIDGLRRLRTRERVALGLKEQLEVRGATAPPASLVRLDVEEALLELDERLRIVVVLNLLQGLTYKEVSDVLGLPVGTVKSRMFAALHELRRRLHEDS